MHGFVSAGVTAINGKDVTTGVVNTGDKFTTCSHYTVGQHAASVVDTGGQYAASVVDIDGQHVAGADDSDRQHAAGVVEC